MRIAIDAHSVGTGLAGNESYATNLIEALAAIDHTNEYTLYVTKKEAVERFSDRWPNFHVRRTLPHAPLIRIPLVLSSELRKRPVDVLHVQFTAPPIAPCPVVVSIHDLSFEHLPETFNRRSRMQLRLTVRHSARKAARLISLSEHGRADLIATYKLSPDVVDVIPLAPSARFKPSSSSEVEAVKRMYGIEGDYILAVGSIQPRKNLSRLIAAYSRLRTSWSKGKLPQLVLVGKRAWLYHETLRTIANCGVQDSVILTGYVPESQLPALYSGALLFVYPSFFEGFGLPPLEAMKCGTAVIVGDRTSLPEVVGDAALLIDPFDTDSLRSGIARLLDDADYRNELCVKGLRRAEEFNWQNTARLTLDVYRKAVGVPLVHEGSSTKAVSQSSAKYRHNFE
ncbi:MAG TPA: glycosyltransferase family 1 protein [Pyrinomonadaceae bacterium]|nr:glycosyltransferase family 1 protein [Pyrinomonadaceae bacterium]